MGVWSSPSCGAVCMVVLGGCGWARVGVVLRRERERERERAGERVRQTVRQTDRQIGRQADRQIDRQADRRQTDWQR